MFKFFKAYKSALTSLIKEHRYIEAVGSFLIFPGFYAIVMLFGQTWPEEEESETKQVESQTAAKAEISDNQTNEGKVTTETYTYTDPYGNTVHVTSTTTWGKEEYLNPAALDLLADGIIHRLENDQKK